jgi:hypothetical protein
LIAAVAGDEFLQDDFVVSDQRRGSIVLRKQFGLIDSLPTLGQSEGIGVFSKRWLEHNGEAARKLCNVCAVARLEASGIGDPGRLRLPIGKIFIVGKLGHFPRRRGEPENLGKLGVMLCDETNLWVATCKQHPALKMMTACELNQLFDGILAIRPIP